MSKEIEGKIECPFYIAEGKRFVKCEGLINKTETVHEFKSVEQKVSHQYDFCCVNGGKKCSHYRNVALLYERGVRA